MSLMSLMSRLQDYRLRVLNETRVASPCPASWEEMEGDDKVRFCSGCRLHVYNLSAMDLEEAANTLLEHEGRLCVRFYRRRDGTTLPTDCPVGVERIQKQRRALAVGAAVALGAGVMAKVGIDIAATLENQNLDMTEQDTFKPIVGVAIRPQRAFESSMPGE
jgi:hypothetical protein